MLESGLGTNGSVVVNWVALRGTPSGALDGTASFNAFTSGTQCERVDFAQVHSPYLLSLVKKIEVTFSLLTQRK